MLVKNILKAIVLVSSLWLANASQAQNTTYDFSSNGQPLEGNGHGVAFTSVSGTFTVDANGDPVSGTLYTNLVVNPDQTFFGNYLPTEFTIFWFNAGGTGVGIRSPVAAGGGDNLTTYYGQSAAGTVTTSGAAPEIDGSLATQVMLLLGCLFLILGREKVSTRRTHNDGDIAHIAISA